MIAHSDYQVNWSEQDGGYVATTSAYPSLSWLAPMPVTALTGLIRLVNETRRGLAKETAASR